MSRFSATVFILIGFKNQRINNLIICNNLIIFNISNFLILAYKMLSYNYDDGQA